MAVKKRIVIVLSLFGIFISVLSSAYAKEIHSTITATVAPHYDVRSEENTLFIETNMTLIVNGKEVKYR